jgi:hypothetical protein
MQRDRSRVVPARQAGRAGQVLDQDRLVLADEPGSELVQEIFPAVTDPGVDARDPEPMLTICRYLSTYCVELGEPERWGKHLDREGNAMRDTWT